MSLFDWADVRNERDEQDEAIDAFEDDIRRNDVEEEFVCLARHSSRNVFSDRDRPTNVTRPLDLVCSR